MAMNCKYCGGKPTFHARGSLKWAICNECGFEVVKLLENPNELTLENNIEREWNIHQFLPKSRDKRY